MLTATDLAMHYGGQTLFEDCNLQLHAGMRYGIVGANGSGKSTLLRLLTGAETPSEGTVTIPKRARVGVLEQDHFRYEDVPILDVVMMGHTEVWGAMRRKEQMLCLPPDEFNEHAYADVEETILRLGGYALESRAAEILEGLQIPVAAHHQPLSTLSGGYKLRVLMARTLAGEPDVLLLDEPNNHLDILSLRWLEKFLLNFKGCAAVVSHDHRFLDNVATHILDVDYQRVTLYKGNYEAFLAQKAAERTRKEAEIEKRSKEIDDHKAFVQRFKAKATKARQANSRQKRIEKIVIEQLPQSSRRYPTFRFEQVRPSGRQALEAIGVSKAYGSKQVLGDVDLTVQRGERVAIIGPNGIGKSTLLKILVGELAADDGLVEWGYETHVGYFAQDHHDLAQTADDNLLSWLWNFAPGQPMGFVYGKLAQVLFSREETEKKLKNLSGGEAARLVLCKLGVLKPNVLLLDEPTNHLDLEGIEALAEGLVAYEGTILFVSHDRWFVSEVATRILEIRADGVEDFHGTYDEYLRHADTDYLDRAVVVQLDKEQRKKKGGVRGRRS